MMGGHEKTKELVVKMNELSIHRWYHEFQDCVSTTIIVEGVEYNIWFGHSNETFGSSVYGKEDEDLGYIETGMIFDKVDMEILAKECIKLVRVYIAGR